MKKIILILALLLAMAIPVSAGGELLVDDADILTNREEEKLLEKLEQASEQYDMDIVIVTVDGIDGEWIRDYADDYYDYNGYSDDGVLLLVDMDEGEWWITGTGKGVDIFSGSVIEDIGDEIEPYLADDEFVDAFEAYIDQCVYYIEDPFEAGISFVVCLVIGLVAALIVTAVLKGQLKSVHSKPHARDYMTPGSLLVTQAHEMYLYSNVTRVRRQQNSSGGSHIGSSGRSHSGGGGRF